MKVEFLENMMKRKKEFLSEIDGNLISYLQGQIDLLEVLIYYEGTEESSE